MTDTNAHAPVAERYQIQIPGDVQFGPAMSELTELQQKFVLAYFQDGGRSAARAAEAAGYCGKGSAAKVAGWRLMQNPKVMAAMKEEAVLTLDRGTIVAVHALVEIAANPEHKDQYKAAADILDRRGFLRVTGQSIEVVDKRTDSELLEYIKSAALKHKLDPRLLLGSDASIEVTAKDITPKAKSAEPAKRGSVKPKRKYTRKGKADVASIDAAHRAEDE